MADIKERIIIEAVDNTTRGMRSAQNKLNAFDRTLKRVQTTMLGFVGINIATHMIQGLTRMSDSAVELDAKLRLMTDSTEDFNYAQQELVKLSLESGSSLEANTILFTRMNKAIKSMGGNTQTTLDTTRALSQGLRISGASTQESASVIRQWSQAMSSGVLRGEEFNAVSENGARIIQALSESLGVSIGQLRAMSKEGELTAQIVTDALLKQSKVLAEENAKLPLTIGRAIENVNTQWTLMLQEMSEGNSLIADGVNTLSTHFTEIASALSTVVEVAIAYAGIGLAKHIIAQTRALRESIVVSREQALATKNEEIAKRLLIQANLEEQAQLSKIALVKKQSHVVATQQHIAELRNTVQRITLSEKELATKVRQLKWQIRSNTATQGNTLARKQLIALQQRSALSSEALRTATMSLAGAEQTLTRALVSQTGAYNANFIAQRKATQNQISGLKKLSKGVKGFISKLASIDVLLSGFMGYEFGSWWYENFELGKQAGISFNWVIQQLIAGFEFLGEAVSAVFTDDTLSSAWDRYKERLNQINSITADMYDNVSRKSEETKIKLTQDNNERVSHTLESLEQIHKAEKDHQKLINAEIDRKAGLRKLNLGQNIADQNEYNRLLRESEQQALEEKDQALVDNMASQLGHYITFYENSELLQTEYLKRQVDLSDTIGVTEDQKKQLAFRINDQIKYQDLSLDLNKAHNKQIQNLSVEKAEKLKEIANEALDALINSANRLVDEERDALERSISVMKEYDEFVKELLGDQRKDYEKLSDAHKLQREIEAKLREASKAEAEGNHRKAQQLNEEALTDSKKLTESYQEISDSADKGSLTQVKAHGAVKIALDLVKEASEGVRDSSVELASTIKDQVEERKKDIETYKQLISELDKQLNIDRIIRAEIDTETVYRQLDAIDEKIKALSQDVIVNVKTIKSEGDTQAKQSGGLIRRAIGGFIPRANKVPGTGSGDKVKALLEPGEFIMRKSAVQKFGESAMYAMNRGDEPVRRQSGGMIPGVQRFASGGSVGTGRVKSTIEHYIEQLDIWIKRSTAPGRGKDAYFKNISASSVVTIIKNILKSLGGLEGKDSSIVQRIIDLNEKVFRSSVSSATVPQGRGMDAYIRAQQDGSDRARNLTVRNALMESLGMSSIALPSGGSRRDDDEGSIIGSETTSQSVSDRNSKSMFGNISKSGYESKFYRDMQKKIDDDKKRKRTRIGLFAEGGSVPGSGLGDTVKALLTPGEYVMKKGIVQQFGTDFMNSINQGIMPQRFAEGGIVGAGIDGVETINVNFNVNGSQATGTFVKNDATMSFIDQLKSSEASS